MNKLLAASHMFSVSATFFAQFLVALGPRCIHRETYQTGILCCLLTPAVCRTQCQVTGIFFESKVDYTTWFGANAEYIHGIQVSFLLAEKKGVRTCNVCTPTRHANAGMEVQPLVPEGVD